MVILRIVYNFITVFTTWTRCLMILVSKKGSYSLLFHQPRLYQSRICVIWGLAKHFETRDLLPLPFWGKVLYRQGAWWCLMGESHGITIPGLNIFWMRSHTSYPAMLSSQPTSTNKVFLASRKLVGTDDNFCVCLRFSMTFCISLGMAGHSISTGCPRSRRSGDVLIFHGFLV